MDASIKKKTIKALKSKKNFKKELSNKLSRDEVESIWKESHHKLAKMLEKYADIPKGVKTHTDNSIFPTAAIYLSLKERYPDAAYDMVKDIMEKDSKKAGAFLAKLSRIPGFNRLFLSSWDPVSHKMFGDTCGFKNKFYPKEKGKFKMDILECPFHKYLTLVGCPEINIFFCNNDVNAYGSIPGLKFTRTQTIGTGGEICDFNMELVKR